MKNNTHLALEKGLLAYLEDRNRKRLLIIRIRCRFTWREMTSFLGFEDMSYVSYVYNYVMHGIVPGSAKIKDLLGIADPQLEYTRSRNAILNRKARAKGYSSWSNFATAVFRDEAEINERF